MSVSTLDRRFRGFGVRRHGRSHKPFGRVQTPTQIFGANLVIWWEFTAAHVVLSGSDITSAINRANPGTYDLPAVAAPELIAGGLDGRDCAEFDGATEYMSIASGLPWVANDTIDVYIVAETQTVRTSDYHMYWDGSPSGLVSLNTDASVTPQLGIQVRSSPTGYGATQFGASDTTPHLLGVTTYDAGAGNTDVHGWLDGSAINGFTGETGLEGPITRMALGGLFASGLAHLRVSEVVAVRNDTNGEAHRLAYQRRIKALYPTIAAALP